MTTLDTTNWPTPTALGSVLDDALASAGTTGPRPPLTYLRRKPGRGMVAVYGRAGTADGVYTVAVDEKAMHSAQPVGSEDRGAGWAGGLDRHQDHFELPALGVTIERFPHDSRLHHLATAMTPDRGGPVWRALDNAAGGRLAAARAVAVRYKPGDRCVIRYELDHSGSTDLRAAADVDGPAGAAARSSLVGKLYGDLEQAHQAHELMVRLWSIQEEEAWVPEPLGVADPLPLVLAEDLGHRRSHPPTVAGTDVIRFAADLPTAALRAAAGALADLHSSTDRLPHAPVRSGADEAAKAGRRAATLAGHAPQLAEEIRAVAGAVGASLEQEDVPHLVASHGSYKPSQLLFRSGAVLLVDFDQFCHADAALDVGYFLAYLRPPGLWYHRAGTRAWFEAAATTFLAAYDERLGQRGADATTRQGVLRRAHRYEAALLLKVAARRANRLHSPRPGEVGAILDEMRTCLSTSK
jgi:hypothetical protein